MTREEFSALPIGIALGLIYDAMPSLAKVQAPKAPFPPKYDRRVNRKGGQYCFASEMALSDLIYYRNRSHQSAESGGQWAEKDRKEAEELGRWVTWRIAFPSDCWRGQRGDGHVTAAPPSRDPELHEWKRGPRASAPARYDAEPAASSGGGGFDDADYGDTGDELPFVFSSLSAREAWWPR